MAGSTSTLTTLHVTTNPLPLREDMRSTDRRTDPILLLYNAIALDVMQSAGIETFSTGNLAAPLADLSYDRGHYKDVVGFYISLLLLKYSLQLCVTCAVTGRSGC